MGKINVEGEKSTVVKEEDEEEEEEISLCRASVEWKEKKIKFKVRL